MCYDPTPVVDAYREHRRNVRAAADYAERRDACFPVNWFSGDRSANDDARKIRTFSGLYVNPLELRAQDVRLVDIAHHLSQINRYTGASPWPLPVAQHSVLVAERAAAEWKRIYPYYDPAFHGRVLHGSAWVTQRDWVAAHLFHDNGEYVFNDLASPVKRDPRMKWYRDLEHQTTRMIFCCFGLDPDLLDLTKPLDDAQFFAEARSFWQDSGEVKRWSSSRARGAFLDMAAELQLEHI